VARAPIPSARCSRAVSSARGAAVAALVVLGLGGALGAEAQAPSLDALFASLRAVSGMECRFHEEKQIALLFTPIVTEGTLHYARPGRLARRTTSPAGQVVLVDGDTLRMRDGEHVETIDLGAQPVVRAFVDTFARLLDGDRAALERSYRLDFAAGQGARWTLTLVPRAAPLDRFLREMRFEGEGSALSRMVMTEVSGDVTTTSFTAVDTARRYGAGETARIFTVR